MVRRRYLVLSIRSPEVPKEKPLARSTFKNLYWQNNIFIIYLLCFSKKLELLYFFSERSSKAKKMSKFRGSKGMVSRGRLELPTSGL